MTRTNIFLAATLLLWSTPLWAHPGGHGRAEVNDPKSSRTWTIAAEGSHLHGAFVSSKDGKVQIRRDDGVLTTLETSRLVTADQNWIAARLAEIKRLNDQRVIEFVAQSATDQPAAKRAVAEKPAPAMLEHFKPFEKTLKFHWDDRHFFVESNGIPDHPMMVGIRAWQQQVPIPQKYIGANAWQIPLQPVPAKDPMSAKNNFLRGAIALAINGVPIFNPLNNRGDDAFLFGELDEYGGHCGRADDYHYHLAPVHLEKTAGKGKPIAYALDGYPIYGYQEPQDPDFAPLDKLNGHTGKDGDYHYHATKTYPYLNGGFHGEVIQRDGQVDPQPRAEPLRPALPPLRDAKITEFVETKPNSYRLTYDVRGKRGSVSYTLADDGSAKFTFVDVDGNSKSENFTPRRRGQGGNDRPAPREDRPPPPRNDPRPPRTDDPPVANPTPAAGPPPVSSRQQLTITSESVNDKGIVSVDCTCDGAGRSPAVAWKNAPAGTKYFAISMWHIAPDQEKSYWLVYDIPADVTQLKENSKNVGKTGLNDKRRAAYDPMCSKGPGVKKYHITVYALSAEPKLAADKATRPNLLAAIKDLTLAEGTLDFQYERKR